LACTISDEIRGNGLILFDTVNSFDQTDIFWTYQRPIVSTNNKNQACVNLKRYSTLYVKCAMSHCQIFTFVIQIWEMNPNTLGVA